MFIHGLLARTNHGKVDVDQVVSALAYFTPADIGYLFHKVSQYAFEQEYSDGRNYEVTTERFIDIIAGGSDRLFAGGIIGP